VKTWPLIALLALLASACSPEPDTPATARPAASAAGTACGTVEVPAHEGVDVQAVGLDCDEARHVVRAAAGRGRAAYDVDGFTCTPTPAPDSDTFYDCIADDGRRVTFRYGVT